MGSKRTVRRGSAKQLGSVGETKQGPPNARASVQQRARRDGIAGVYGNRGTVESVSYRF